MTKERVFAIMGSYYGNAYYRSAIRLGISEDDLKLTAELLDKINSLGYAFSNLHKLMETEDIRFPPLILSCFDQFTALNYQVDALSTIRFKSYSEFVPQLLQIYQNTGISQIRVCASECVLSINSTKHINECLKIVSQPNYGAEHDFLIAYLCKQRVKNVIPRLLNLLEQNPKVWRWTFLRYVTYFKESSLIPYVEPFLQDNDGEVRALAKKAIKKLESFKHRTVLDPKTLSLESDGG